LNMNYVKSNMHNRHFIHGIYTSDRACYAVTDLACTAIGKPTIQVPMHKLERELTKPRWDDDLSPFDVIVQIQNNEIESHDHAGRITHAQLKYPIIIDSNYYILDGCHRLAKYYLADATTVDCVMLMPDDLASIAQSINNFI